MFLRDRRFFAPEDGGTGGAGAGAGPAAGGPANGAGSPWYSGADPTIVGYFENKGWATKTAAEAAIEAAKAHQQAEKFIGAPASELIRLPKPDAPEADWKAVWARLGAPSDPKEYDFSGVKFADGTELDGDFAEFMRATAAKLNLPKTAASELTKAFVAHLDKVTGLDSAEKTAALQTEKQTLAANWGKNYEANLFIAKSAAEKLGVDAQAIAALEGAVGYGKVMEMFRNIGMTMGEAKYVSAGGQVQNGVMTRDGAKAQLAALKADTEWVGKLMKGDAAANREFQALTTLIAGGER